MKLWDKGMPLDAAVERFTVGRDREMDAHLAYWDVLASIAHVRMLHENGLLEEEDARLLVRELQRFGREWTAAPRPVPESMEDVHTWIEAVMTERCGDAGRRMHAARSRNDQVLTALRLALRARLRDIVDATVRLARLLLDLGQRHRDVLLPGYTHLQVAMPSSFGLWFGAWAESLADDLVLLEGAYRLVDRNPLGSGAGYGSSFPINRTRTTELLGFSGMNRSSVYAQMTRGRIERVTASAASGVASTLARLASDVCLYASQNFGFLRLPDAFTTGSSLMPHKRNPDVFELVRARGNRLLGLQNDIALVTANLPSGYHRDMQILKELVFPALDDLQQCLDITGRALEHIEPVSGLLDDPRYRDLGTVDAVAGLVEQGMPFRDAYRIVGEEVVAGRFTAPPRRHTTHEGSIDEPGLEEIAAWLDEVAARFEFHRSRQAEMALMSEGMDGGSMPPDVSGTSTTGSPR